MSIWLLTRKSQINHHANAAFTQDLNSLRRDMHQYLPDLYFSEEVHVPRLTQDEWYATDGSFVGYQTPCMLRLCAPISVRGQIDRALRRKDMNAVKE